MKRDRITFIATMVGRFGRERWNEHVKMFASAMSGVSVASFIGALVAPLVNSTPPGGWAIPMLIASGVILHVAAHLVLRYYQGKE